MHQNFKKLFVILGVAILVVMFASSLSYVSFAQTERNAEEQEEEECNADEWFCGNWSSCSGEIQTRDCTMTFDCDNARTPQPTISQRCTPPPALPDEDNEDNCSRDEWFCGAWSRCNSNSEQTRDCTMTFDCDNARTPQPTISQRCTPPPAPPDEDNEDNCSRDEWFCGAWSRCNSNGEQTRDCTMTFDCDNARTPQPTISQRCTPPPPPPPVPPDEDNEDNCSRDEWSCGEWSKCNSNGEQTRDCVMTSDCNNVRTPQPTISQRCTPPQTAPTITEQTPPPVPPDEDNKDNCSRDEWFCRDWSKCNSNGEQTRDCVMTFDCDNARTPQPAIFQRCTTVNVIERKQLEEELIKQQEQRIKAAQEESKKNIDELEKTEEDPEGDADNDGIPNNLDYKPYIADANNNGILDGLDKESGQDLTVVDKEDIQLQTNLIIKQYPTGGGGGGGGGGGNISPAAPLSQQIKKERSKQKREKIKKVSKKKFKVEIKDDRQDSDGDGISDSVAVSLGINPKDKRKPIEGFTSVVEMKLYGFNEKKLVKSKKVTMNIPQNGKLNKKGSAVLAVCEKNQFYSLYAFNKNDKKILLDNKKCTLNNKMVFVTDNKKLKPGKYLIQIIKESPKISFLSFRWLFADVVNATENSIGSVTAGLEKSDPVSVDILEDSELPAPIIKSIENVEVAGLHDINISQTQDGRVHVTGISDITSMVVGTFSSAVFTSAMLADVEDGYFEIISSQPLEAGEHEVVVYATQPEELIQSEPIRLRFSIIETAKAAAEEITPHPVAEEKGFPLVQTVAVSGIVILLVIIGIIRKKKKQSGA